MRIDSVELLEHCKALLAGFFVLGLLLAFALYAMHWLWDDVRITLYMEKAEAVVSNVTEHWEDGPGGHSGGYVYDFSYTFRSPDGRKVTTGRVFNGGEPPPTIGVEYERSNPENCRTEDDWAIPRNYSLPLFILGVVVWVGGLAFITCIGSINGSILALWGSDRSRAPFPALARFGGRAVALLSPLYGNRIRGLWEGEAKRSSIPAPRVVSQHISAVLIAACGIEIAFGTTLGQIATSDARWGYAWLVLALIGIGSYAGLHAAVMVMYPKTR